MVLQLAEKFTHQPGLYDRLITNRPEANVRSRAVELVSMLNAGKMDYGWEYLSVAVQKGFKYVALDDHINLGNYKFDDYYAQAKVKVTGKKPGTWITRTGQSCTYGITLIQDALNREGAISILAYLLSPEGGLKVFKNMGQPPLVPRRVPDAKTKNKLPQALADPVEVRQ